VINGRAQLSGPLFDTMKITTLLCLLVFPLAVSAQSALKSATEARLLTEMVTGPALWDATADQFEMKFQKLGLEWLSPAKDQARFFGNYAVFSNEVKTPETIAEFQGGRLVRVNVSIFNRGDSANLAGSKDEFEKQVESIKSVITTNLGVQPTERGKDTQSAVKAVGWMWLKPPTAYLLEYSYVKEIKSRDQEFRPEFIRLRVAQIPKQQGLLSTAQSGSSGGNQAVSKTTLASNITREPNGDVVIKNVPMVDQGPKGYCAVATTERVFRYYGIAVDQHELAQIANTGDGGGTSPTEMLAALEKIEARMRVRVRALQKFDFQDFLRMVNDYNREAKRNDKHVIDLPSGGLIDIGDIYASMDADSLKITRTEKDKSGYGKFQRSIADTIEKGVPVMWGVELGLFKEGNLPQAGGGHMRLIIGYNTMTSEILYSDSWGAEHALKRMPMDQACTITNGLYYVEPMK
jgi:hypothetical protein